MTRIDESSGVPEDPASRDDLDQAHELAEPFGGDEAEWAESASIESPSGPQMVTDVPSESGAGAAPSAPLGTGAAAQEAIRGDDMGDAAGIPGPVEPTLPTGATKPEPNWDRERNPLRIAFELKRIEAEVRSLLENRDPKRKRRLAGTRRWNELEEDIIAHRHTGRIDEPSLLRLSQLITRRHYLFRRLRFVSSTRPTLNS